MPKKDNLQKELCPLLMMSGPFDESYHCRPDCAWFEVTDTFEEETTGQCVIMNLCRTGEAS